MNKQREQELYAKMQALRANMPEDAQHTDGYPLMQMLVCPEDFKQVPDIMAGGNRNRRWCAILSLSVSAHFDKGPSGQAVYPILPTYVFDGDTKETLRARLIHEIDVALEMALENKPDDQ